MRVFPLSNWTEKDIWNYIQAEGIEIVPLYFAKERPVVERDGKLSLVDDERFPLKESEQVQNRSVRFKTLGCYPLTGGMESQADTLEQVVAELEASSLSERSSRIIDFQGEASMEKRKKEGYF